MNPKVSICIPTYRQLNYLAKCLDSILVQNYFDYEVVVTDDSPDESVSDLLKQYDFKGRLVYCHNSPALGSPKNWNKGLGIARGEYIKILHHDDWFAHPASLGDYVNLLDKNPKADFGFSACTWVFPEQGREKRMTPTKVQIQAIKKNPAGIFPENFISTPSTIIFRNRAKELFDEQIKWMVDSEYYFRMLLKNKNFAYTDSPLVNILVEAAHQVTAETRGNKQTEIKEWIYFYNKIRKIQGFNLPNYQHLRKVFKNFGIRSLADLHAIGITEVSPEIRSILWYDKANADYTKYFKSKGFVKHVGRQIIPRGSRREMIAKPFFLPVNFLKQKIKKNLLEGRVLLSESLDRPEIVTVSRPSVRGFEIDNSTYNYGIRISIECEKVDLTEKAWGRWQVNWMDANNNFVFATCISFELNATKDVYISPLINNIPLFVKRGLLYLGSDNHTEIKVTSYGLTLYSISNDLFRKVALRSNSGRVKASVKKRTEAKNLLFIIPWMSVGGGDMVNLILMKHLNEKGYNIHIFTSEKSKNEWRDRFEKITKNIVVLPSLIRNAKSRYDYFDTLLTYIREANIETVFVSNSEFGYDCLPIIKSEFPHIKLFDILHGQGGQKEGGGFPEYSKQADRFLDKRITINGYLKNYLVERYGISPNKISVIRNGIDTDRFNNNNGVSNGVFRVSFIGRLSYEKHPELIIEIAQKFKDQFNSDSLVFHIIGDGPMLNELKIAVVEKNLESLVYIKGYSGEIIEELEHTDVLVLCSEMEGLPIVLLEAMSMSVPCIATNVGGIPELIDDTENGFLIDFNNEMVDTFAERINLLYTNLSLRKELGAKARQKVTKQFSISKMMTGYLSLLEKHEDL